MIEGTMDNQHQIRVGELIKEEFFNRCVDEVAAGLIGCLLFVEDNNGRVGGRNHRSRSLLRKRPSSTLLRRQATEKG